VLVLERLDGDELSARRSGYFANVRTADALRAEWLREGMGPLRARAHALADGDPLHDGHGRAAAVGLAVVATHAGRVLLGRRSRSLAADPGLWHVAPSGMLEPGTSVEAQVERELREELGVEGAEAPRMLGVGFDLLRLRPELCLTLELSGEEVQPGAEFSETRWIDPTDDWPADLTPAAAAALALFSGTLGIGP
jgi:ADP-ribose pyrophosphatase YjhB (NUDIX family)